MNHKRRRPKHQRAGCLWCKPHKDERLANEPRQPTLTEAKLLDEVDEYWGGRRHPPLTIDALFDHPRRPKDRRHNCGGKSGLEHVPIWERMADVFYRSRLELRCERCGKMLGQSRRLPKVA